LLQEVNNARGALTLVDHGAGKSYLGFILYDLFFKTSNPIPPPTPPLKGGEFSLPPFVSTPHQAGLIVDCLPLVQGEGRGGDGVDVSHIYGIETREELVTHSRELAQQLGFGGMSFLNLSVAESIVSDKLPASVDVVTALHACDTATDDAINFALKKQARHIVLVPCCQAEVAAVLRKNKGRQLAKDALTELWRHPIHTREFGSHLTNVLRCLQLEAHGYQVTVTELVGWEHSMKNELIIASFKDLPRKRAVERLGEVLQSVGLEEMSSRFFV
jgi:hypothetical protein